MVDGADGAGLPSAAPAPSVGIGYREAGTWTSAEGVEWRAIVVPAGASHGALMRLAHRLHLDMPTTFFDVFDDDAELPKLIAAKGDDDALPHAWRETHEIATIAGTVGSQGGVVTVSGVKLFEWKTMETTPVK